MKKLKSIINDGPNNWEEFVVFATVVSLGVFTFIWGFFLIILFFFSFPLTLLIFLIPISYAFYKVLTNANN